jgi:hypothetical protein
MRSKTMQASITQGIRKLSAIDLNNLEEIILLDPANWVDLNIRRSEHPCLTISGNKAMVQRYRCSRSGNTLNINLMGSLIDRIVDAFTTSLTRKRILVELAVDSLDRVRATGMVEVDVEGWKEDDLEIHLFGPTTLWGERFLVMKA